MKEIFKWVLGFIMILVIVIFNLLVFNQSWRKVPKDSFMLEYSSQGKTKVYDSGSVAWCNPLRVGNRLWMIHKKVIEIEIDVWECITKDGYHISLTGSSIFEISKDKDMLQTIEPDFEHYLSKITMNKAHEIVSNRTLEELIDFCCGQQSISYENSNSPFPNWKIDIAISSVSRN